MTPEEFDAKIQSAHPKAVDFPQSEFYPDRSRFEIIASRRGYRFVGYRLQRAVFSTKPSGEDRVKLSLPKKEQA